jgi:hypothetical protein
MISTLVVSYASELARWGIETSVIVAGAFTSGTNYFKNAGSPNVKARAVEYDSGPHHRFTDQVQKGVSNSLISILHISKSVDEPLYLQESNLLGVRLPFHSCLKMVNFLKSLTGSESQLKRSSRTFSSIGPAAVVNH